MLINDSTTGLYKTCKYLKNGQVPVLEESWILMVSHIGKYVNADVGGDTLVHITAELVKILESDSVRVPDALVMTAKLYLLWQKVKEKSSYKEETVQKLRERIIGNYPEGAALSYQGLQKFSRIMPAMDDENYIFYNRILAGLTRLLSENEIDDIRASLEYFTRKKLKMPAPNVWPAPNMKEAKRGDPIWILWGAILLHFDEAKVATNFKLFNWNARQTVAQRNERVGLLWCLPYCIRTNVATIWTKEELKILERVAGIAKELWSEITATAVGAGADGTGRGGGGDEPEAASIMNSFYPRNPALASAAYEEPLYSQQLGASASHGAGTGAGSVKVLNVGLDAGGGESKVRVKRRSAAHRIF